MINENISYWNKTGKRFQYPRLDTNLEVDVLIIGSGISGITCAYCLTQKGAKPVVIEAGGLCDGTTGNTTGKLSIQHNIIYSHIADKYGLDFARLYAESQTKAIDFVKDVVSKEEIDCQLAESTSYIYATTKEERKSLLKEYEIATKIDIDAEFIDSTDFPEDNLGMLGFKNQAVFHSVRYINALAELAVLHGAEIYCDTKASKIEDGDIKTIYCDNGLVIKAKHLVMATQYPIYDGPNVFYTRLYAKRDYGIAVNAKSDWADGSYINVGDPARSVRTHVEDGKRILIVVGDSHATGRKEKEKEDHYDNLIRFADKIAGVDEVLARWSAQDYETPDQIPYIGRISDNSNVYVATGYGKWGLSKGTLSGMMISDLITTGNCEYEKLYSRTRGDISSSFGNVVTEVFSSVGELIKSKIEDTESYRDIKQGEGRVITYNGQKAGIYRGFDDGITIITLSCTHMSTIVNFNPLEKTWDCPAHGGRYAADGRLLEGPPKNCLKILYSGSYSEFFGKDE